MTPQLQQAIRLLQLPAMELQATIREALESNVMLEAEEEELVTVDTAEIPQLNYEQREHLESSSQTDSDEPSSESLDDTGAEHSDEASEAEWADKQVTGESDTPWSGDGNRQDEFADSSGETLRDHLLLQLECPRVPELDRKIGAAITMPSTRRLLVRTTKKSRRIFSLKLRWRGRNCRVLKHVHARTGGRRCSPGRRCIERQLRQLDPTPRVVRLPFKSRNILGSSAGSNSPFCVVNCACRRELERVGLVRAANPPRLSIHAARSEYVVPMYFVRRTEHVGRRDQSFHLPKCASIKVTPTAHACADHATLRTQLQEARWLYALGNSQRHLIEGCALHRKRHRPS